MTIYVVIKGAREITGEWMMAATEKAFTSKEMAQQYLSTQQIVWEEIIDGFECTCERAIHETELI